MNEHALTVILHAALRHYQAGEFAEAEKLYRQVLAAWPDCAHALHMLGLIAMAMKQFEPAVRLISRAVALEPNSFEARNNLGNAFKALQKWEQAIECFRAAVLLNPASPQAHYNLGNALRAQGDIGGAIDSYQRAVQLQENFPEALNNLGEALFAQGKVEAAIELYGKAIAFNPNYAEAHNNFGAALEKKGKLDEALASFEKAAHLEPDRFEAHSNSSRIYQTRGELRKGRESKQRARALRPDVASMQSGFVFDLHYDPAQSPAVIHAEHRRFEQDHADKLKQYIRPHDNDRSSARRLKIGYVSPDFRLHSVAHFALPLLEAHDREHFDVACYSTQHVNDAITERFKKCANQFRVIADLDDGAAAEIIRKDQIDILVDLAGHSRDNALLVFARRPAPVQVTYLGYPDTTGLSTVGYRFTDEKADPPGLTDQFNSERLIRLPETAWCFTPLSGSPETAPPPVVANGYVTFGSFNARAKLSEMTLKLWAALLKEIPTAKLLIKNQSTRSEFVCRQLRDFFAAEGVGNERLQLVPPEASGVKHLEWYNQIDIALDSFPYHGTTTTCEALWMAVPTVTLAGQTHVSRVGVSLLMTVGLENLIAQTPEEYGRIAAELARDIPRLREIRSGLRERMRASSLMDAARFGRNVERAYREIWQKWCHDRG